MRRLRAFFFRLAGLLIRHGRERELADELESHLRMHIEDNLRSGMTPVEARRQALIKLGGIEQTKEIYRDRRGNPLLEGLSQDVRYSFRMLRKGAGFTALVVLTLALGIGANTAIFTLIDGLLLKRLPVHESDRLVALIDPAAQKVSAALPIIWNGSSLLPRFATNPRNRFYETSPRFLLPPRRFAHPPWPRT